MIRYNQLRTTYVARDEVVVKKRRLEQLEKIERAHAAYLMAARQMHNRMMVLAEPGKSDYPRGYDAGFVACLREFSEAVLDAARRQEAA